MTARATCRGAAALVALALATSAHAQPTPDGGVPAPDGGPAAVDGPRLVDVSPPQVSASAAPSELPLGETFTLFVEVVFDEQLTVNLPSTLDLAPLFDELRRTSRDEVRTDGTRKRIYQLELRAWELGDLTLPPIQVGYAAGGERSWVVTNAVPLRVVGVLGDADDKTALLDDAPPMTLRRRDWRWPLALAALVVVAAVVLLARRFRRRPQAATAMVAAPTRTARVRLPGSAERALAALAALEAAGTLGREPRVGYEELVVILRRFWNEQLGVGIRDRTSGELVTALGKTSLPAALVADSRRWLDRCDLVKYARVVPDAAAIAEDLGAARALVRAAVMPAPSPTAPASPLAEEGP